MSIDEETRSALQAAAQATDADVLLAKQVALAALDNGQLLSRRQLHERLCLESGVPAQADRREHLDVDGRRRGNSQAFDATAPLVMRVRCMSLLPRLSPTWRRRAWLCRSRTELVCRSGRRYGRTGDGRAGCVAQRAANPGVRWVRREPRAGARPAMSCPHPVGCAR
jgi:hypothetical protein